MKIGDAVRVPGDHEGFVVEFDRYGQKGSVCAFINFGGDGMYVDYLPENLRIIPVAELSQTMRRDCYEIRRKTYMEDNK